MKKDRKQRHWRWKGMLCAGLATGLCACGAQTVEEVKESSVAVVEQEETESFVDKMDRSDEGYELVWQDEFEGDSLDLTKWSYQYGTGAEYGLDGWGNSEEEYYTDRPENVRVEDGKLILTAIKEEEAYEQKPYTSGRIRTVSDEETLFATTYGRIEARIRMPEGEGIWPAFWMLPVDETIYGGWAASGEIDIMEAKGRLPGQIGGTLHYGQVWPNNTYKTQDYFFPAGTDITDFHLYTLEWGPDEMRWLVDDECYFTMDQWYAQGKFSATEYASPAPYDVPFYIIFDLAVGGTFDPEADLTKAQFPSSMEVDFVRVYHKTEGYEVKKEQAAEDRKDEEGYTHYASEYADGQFITDPEFSTMNTGAIKDTDNDVVPTSKDWQFAVGNFGGDATAAVEELEQGKFARIDIASGGNQSYAVQLIQHLPIVEGYTYEVTFDAKASEKRSIVVSPSGDGDNAWKKYASFDVNVGTEVENYSYTFKMYGVTDPTARLEFNLGLSIGSIWIGNVQVRVVATEGGVDTDCVKKPLNGGNRIYNGTFDQGADRLAYWHAEDLEVTVPDYTMDEQGKEDFSRWAELSAAGENPCLYQRGIPIEGGKNYVVRFDLQGEADNRIVATLTGSDGTVYLEETCEYISNSGEQHFEYRIAPTDGVLDEGAVFSITMPDGGDIWLDNVRIGVVNK